MNLFLFELLADQARPQGRRLILSFETAASQGCVQIGRYGFPNEFLQEFKVDKSFFDLGLKMRKWLFAMRPFFRMKADAQCSGGK